MAFFNKLKFWKKKDDDLGLGDLGDLPPFPDDTNLGLPELGPSKQSAPGYPATGYGQQQTPVQERPLPRAPITPQQYQEIAPAPQYGYQQNKDIEIVSAKLDSIRASLESINQRLANIERIAYREEEQPRIKRQW